MANNRTLADIALHPLSWVKKRKKAKFGKTYKISKAPAPKITSAERKRILHEATGKTKYAPKKPKEKKLTMKQKIEMLRKKQKEQFD